jgi:Arc/MetJ-type ribon-helix-helix transcriptional regulator
MDETPTTLRLPRDLLDRAERLAEDGLGTGARVSRSLVLRRAVELGLDALDSAAGDLSPTAAAEVRAELEELRARMDRLEQTKE